MPLPLERILRCVPEPPLCVRANQRDGIAPIPAICRSPLGRQARPKAHLLGSHPNRENTQANQTACDAELTRRLDPAIIGGVTKGIVTQYLADANGGSRRILRPDCRSGISRICWKIDCQGELNRLRTIDHRRVAIDRIWMLDILKKYQSIQHQRRRLNVIFGNGLRQLGVREENNPVKGRARSLIYS